jgi:hypothetical protein
MMSMRPRGARWSVDLGCTRQEFGGPAVDYAVTRGLTSHHLPELALWLAPDSINTREKAREVLGCVLALAQQAVLLGALPDHSHLLRTATGAQLQVFYQEQVPRWYFSHVAARHPRYRVADILMDDDGSLRALQALSGPVCAGDCGQVTHY